MNIIQVLSPLGNFPHPRGIQIVDKISFFRMKKNIIWKRLTFQDIPIFDNGHPDDGFDSFKIKTIKSHICGYVKDIVLSDGAILAICNYNKTGISLVHELISIGITNNPNIKVSGTPFKTWELVPSENAK